MQRIIQETLDFAANLQNKINSNLNSEEKIFHQKMQSLLNNPKAKIHLISLLDCSFRCKDFKTSFAFIQSMFKKYGYSSFFSQRERVLLFLFFTFGRFIPNISVRFFIQYLRKSTQNLVLDAKDLESKIAQNKHCTLNINLIGEEVLGNLEADSRLQKYKNAIKNPHINYISIKITTIFSQINIVDFNYCKNEIVKRLDSLYALALEESKKQNQPKFINLDMEEFRDLELTCACFMDSIKKFDLEAGIVLQAYVPDSYFYLKKLFYFSKERVLAGKKPIKIRFVKGANMANEEIIAAQKGWNLATFTRKIDTDSNYKKMLDFVLENENFKYIKIGIASHNIFEISYCYIRAKNANALESFSFEQLCGMSPACSNELNKIHNLILYAPACESAHFNNAIAYLVRRLDENTAKDNFMRHFFGLKVGSEIWEAQQKLFLDSLENMKKIKNETNRIQNRNQIAHTPLKNGFENESDTDFILEKNRIWAQNIKAKYEHLSGLEIYPVIGDLGFKNLEKLQARDKINNEIIADIYLAGKNEIKAALNFASEEILEFDYLHKILNNVALKMREQRGDLIGIAMREVGKTIAELDSEVSEAIDFCNFYPHALKTLTKQNPESNFKPKGKAVVIAPWNFPIGISAGGIAANLACGNAVIYKPSSSSIISGYFLCKIFWEAGIPKNKLIFLPSKGSDINKYLLSSDEIKTCVLTGGEETAYKMLNANPRLNLSAETGGKNATIVTKMADRDQAIKNIIHSSFSNSGQKCSATSLLILESEVYDDLDFKNALIDATNSLEIGSPFNLKNKLSSLCDKPNQKIKKALKNLAPHESWALEARFIDGLLMSPAIKYGTKVGDFTHKTELFAPILSVIRAKNLNEAINIANATDYGLTAGLESLDENEWEIFINNIEAGNIYINKPTTGAIVARQPFGGIKKSAIGFGRKVGIFNYVTQFLDISQNESDKNLKNSDLSDRLEILSSNLKNHANELQKAAQMAKSYAFYFENEFSKSREIANIRGEDNIFCYKKIKNLAYRISQNDSLSDILSTLIAGKICNIKINLSYENNQNLDFIKQNLPIFECDIAQESESEFIKKIPHFERIFYYGNSDLIYEAASSIAKIIKREKPSINGRFELLFYFNEQALSISFHRYGNLGARALNQH